MNPSVLVFDRKSEGHSFVSRKTIMCYPVKQNLLFVYYFYEDRDMLFCYPQQSRAQLFRPRPMAFGRVA